MVQKNFIRNVSGTACFLSFTFSTINVNSTMVINVNDNYKSQKVNYSDYNESLTYPLTVDISNICETNSSTELEEIANTLFGKMRNATPEEQEDINKYIKSISKGTGLNFFNIC